MNLGLVRAGIDEIRTIITKKGGYTYPRLLNVKTLSKKPQFLQDILGALPDIPQWTKGSPVTPLSRKPFETVTVNPIFFAGAYEFDVIDEAFDQYGEQVAKIPGLFTKSEQRTLNRYGVYLHNNAFNSNITIYDGQTLASTAHTSVTGVATRSNRPTILKAFSTYNLETELQELRKTLDPDGNPLDNEEGMADLVSGLTLEPVVQRTLKALNLAQTSDNDPNWLKGQVRFNRQRHISSDTFWSLQYSNGDHGLTMFKWGGTNFKRIQMNQNLAMALVIWLIFRPMCMQWEGTRFCNS